MKKVEVLLFMMSAVLLLHGASAFVVNSNSQTLSKIDLDSGMVDNDFALLGQVPGTAPNKMAITEAFAYVVVTYENVVQKIALDGSGSSFISLEDSALPNDIAYADGFLYVTGNGSNRCYKVDCATDQVIGQVAVGTAPQGLVVYDDHLLVANTGFDVATYTYEPGTVSVISLADFMVESVQSTATNPADFALVGDAIHVICTGDYVTEFGAVTVINGQTLQTEETFDLGGSPNSISYDGANTVYCGNAWPAGVYTYDAFSHDVISTPDDGIFVGGNDVQVNDGTLAVIDAMDYIQNSHARIYSLADQQLLADYEVGVGATDIVFSLDGSGVHNLPPAITAQLNNFPNPFKPSGTGRSAATTIYFETTNQHETAQIEIYNIRGQKVKQLEIINDKLSGDLSSRPQWTCAAPFRSNEGMESRKLSYSITWDGTDSSHQLVASGLYFYQLKLDGRAVAQSRMMLIK